MDGDALIILLTNWQLAAVWWKIGNLLVNSRNLLDGQYLSSFCQCHVSCFLFAATGQLTTALNLWRGSYLTFLRLNLESVNSELLVSHHVHQNVCIHANNKSSLSVINLLSRCRTNPMLGPGTSEIVCYSTSWIGSSAPTVLWFYGSRLIKSLCSTISNDHMSCPINSMYFLWCILVNDVIYLMQFFLYLQMCIVALYLMFHLINLVDRIVVRMTRIDLINCSF